MSRLMCHFYLQCPPSFKQLKTWDVDCVLSLLEAWVLASSLSAFKVAWKTATHSAFGTTRYCSALTLLFIDNQHLFPLLNAAIFIQSFWW